LGNYQLSTTTPRYTEEEIVATVGGSGRSRTGAGFGPFVMGPFDLVAPLLPGSPTSHAHTFVTVDEAHRYVSAR
jgi:hypothetical protein